MAGKFILLDEAAKLLGITPEALVELRQSGEIHGYRDGSSWKFKQEEIQRVIEERAGGAGEALADSFGAGIPDDDDEGSSVLLSDSADAGLQRPSAVVGEGAATSDSDLNLLSDGSSDLGKDSSDVSLIPDSASDSDVALVAEEGGDKLEAGSHLQIEEDQDTESSIKLDEELKSDSSIKLDEDLPSGSSLKLDDDLGSTGSSLKLDDEVATGSSLKLDDDAATGSSLKLDDAMSTGSNINLDEEAPTGSSLDAQNASTGSSLDAQDATTGSSLVVDDASTGSGLSEEDSSDSMLNLLGSSDDTGGKLTGGSSDIVSGSADVLGESNQELKLATGSGTGELGSLSDLSLDSGDLDLSDDELALDDDDDLVVGGSGIGSKMSLSHGDSGINLASPSDSGLSLEDDALEVGSSASSLELPEDDDDMLELDGSGSGAPAEMQQDEEFLLSPSGELGPDDFDESDGSQVIALEDSAPFGEDAAALVDGGRESMAGPDMGLESQLVDPAAQLAPTGGYAGPAELPEEPYSIWNVMGLSLVLLFLLLTGVVMMDVIRNLWAWESSTDLGTGITGWLVSMFRLNP